ncbi:MAG TPA: hypothetical protein VN083_03100, partial [Vicinamibacteria bacterium]|nr:hypothetical protein [Vicinamibacteria bacterium]
ASTSFGLLPSDWDGPTAPPAGSPNFFLELGVDGSGNLTGNSLDLWKFHTDFANPGNASFSGPLPIPVAGFVPACGGLNCIPQANSGELLDSLGDRLMYRLAYRNIGPYDSLVVNHSVAVGGRSGIRWYEIRSPGGAVSIFQQSTFSPDGNSRWMGSAAMDGMGDIALGYSVSGPGLNPSIFLAGRVANDPLSTLEQEVEIQPGSGSQSPPPPGVPARAGIRWGDYSAMTLDPADDCTFWYANQYLPQTGIFNWDTRLYSFKLPGCIFDLSLNPVSQSVVAGSTATTGITITRVGGFAGAVGLFTTGLPSGGISPDPAPGSSATLTVPTTAGTAGGVYAFTLFGTSGTVLNLAHGSITVQNFSLAVSPSPV